MPVHGHVGQLPTQIGVVVGATGDGIGSLRPQTVGIVGVIPLRRTVQLIHGSQLSAMLPGIAPNKVVGGVADFVTHDGSFGVGFQQISPLGVGIVIVGLDFLVLSFGDIGANRPAQDMASIVVGPKGNGIGFLVILPDQLIGRIVGIAGRICAVKTVGEAKGTDKLSP